MNKADDERGNWRWTSGKGHFDNVILAVVIHLAVDLSRGNPVLIGG